MGLRKVSLVLLVCILSYGTCYIGAVPSCTNYRPMRVYGNWCFKYPLHWAAQAGHTRELTKLIHDGADINQQTYPGRWTPMHFAANYGRANVVNLLLNKGANPLLVTRDNFTPRHRAGAKYCKGYRTNAACGLSNFNYYRTNKLLEKAEQKIKSMKNKQSKS